MMPEQDVVMTKAGAVTTGTSQGSDSSEITHKAETAAEAAEGHTEDHHLEVADMIRIAFVALACAAVWFRVWEPYPRVSIIGLVAALVGMYPILKEALEALLARPMAMELSMTLALAA